MPDYSDSTKYPNIGNTLAEMGQGFRIGAFDQTSFNKWVKTNSTGQSLGDGYCAGVVTDWLRRVLLPGNKGDREDRGFLTYHYKEFVENKTSQDLLRAQKTAKRMGEAWTQSNALNWWSYSGEDTSTAKPEEWKNLAEGMDMRGGKSNSTRRFTGLQLLASKQKVYESDEWLADILGGPTDGSPIAPGCGAKLGFGLPGKNGHAVAVWRRRTNTDMSDSFYFFDPNWGVYAFSRNGLESALVILFATPYHSTEYGAHIPHYKSCSSADGTRMNYLVFGPPHKMDARPERVSDEQPPVQGVQTPVQTQQSPVQTVHAPVQTLQAPVKTVNAPVQTLQPSVQTGTQQGSPANAYTTPNTGLSQPGNVSSASKLMATAQPDSTGLKEDLEKALGNKDLYTYAFMGKQGGYVKLDPALAAQIKEKGPGVYKQKGFQWPADAVLEQPAGKYRHAILKTSLQKLIDWL